MFLNLKSYWELKQKVGLKWIISFIITSDFSVSQFYTQELTQWHLWCHSGEPSKLNFQWGSCRWILGTTLLELSDQLPRKPIPAAGVIFWVTAATQRLCSPRHSCPTLVPPRNTLLVATLRWQRLTHHNNYCSGDLKNSRGPWAKWEELHQTDHIIHVENQDLKPYDQDELDTFTYCGFFWGYEKGRFYSKPNYLLFQSFYTLLFSLWIKGNHLQKCDFFFLVTS